jgi:hypothetical protein
MYEAVGRAEEEMPVRGLDVTNEEWGYQVLYQISSDGPEIQILAGEVFGWPGAARWKLKEKAKSDETVRKYVRSLNCDYHQRSTAEETALER